MDFSCVSAWATSIIVGVLCFLGPFMGAFLNRFGIRITTILGCLTCSAGLVMGSFAPSIVAFYAAFSLPFGVGLTLIYVSSPIVATHYFKKRRSIALGLVTAGQGLGTMAIGPSLQALTDVLDWRNAFRVFAGILFLASLTGCLLHQGISPPNGNGEDKSKKFCLNLSLLKNPVLPILMLTRGVYSFCRLVPYTHLVKHCDDLGIPANKSAILFLFIGVFATIGRIGGGFLCNIKCVKARIIFQAAAFIMGTSTMIMTLAKTYGALVPCVIVFSLADGMTITTFIIECLNSVEESKKASAFGFTLIASGVFAVSSPPLSGMMADKFGNYIAAFLMSGGVGIIASVIPFLLLCVKRKPEETSGRDLPSRQQDCENEQELTSNTTMGNNTHQRPVSFIISIESSI